MASENLTAIHQFVIAAALVGASVAVGSSQGAAAVQPARRLAGPTGRGRDTDDGTAAA